MCAIIHKESLPCRLRCRAKDERKQRRHMRTTKAAETSFVESRCAANAETDADTLNEMQPARKSNIEAIVAYFASGITPAAASMQENSGRVGIELEHIIVHEDSSPVTYSEPFGVQWILQQLQSQFPQTTCDTEGDLLGVARKGETVTLEPAAQLELSAGPFESLDQAYECFQSFERTLSAIIEPANEKTVLLGYHPKSRATDMELIPKQRYRFMNEYLSKKGPFGIRMMRGSASTQVSIDYSSIPDCLRKLRLAFALAPIFSLICDNSPIFEGAPRTHELVRTEIWQHCDPDRCGLVPNVMEPDFSLEQYAAYLLDTPAILVPDEESQWRCTQRTFGELYAQRTMTQAEIEHALSMFFTDVRLKTYLEIRPADALPIPYAIAYAALVKGLFYSPKNLDALDNLFIKVRNENIEEAKTNLMALGYRATVYERPVADLVDEIMSLGREGLGESERCYLEPLARLAAARETLAKQSERQGVQPSTM